MLGYMTKKEALEFGFTHHGKYYGIPIWITAEDDAPMVATKWAPMEYVMTLFHYVEAIVRSVAFPSDEPAFMFRVGKRIE